MIDVEVTPKPVVKETKKYPYIACYDDGVINSLVYFTGYKSGIAIKSNFKSHVVGEYCACWSEDSTFFTLFKGSVTLIQE